MLVISIGAFGSAGVFGSAFAGIGIVVAICVVVVHLVAVGVGAVRWADVDAILANVGTDRVAAGGTSGAIALVTAISAALASFGGKGKKKKDEKREKENHFTHRVSLSSSFFCSTY